MLNNQRGIAIILVLIIVGVGAVIMVPTLRYANTSLKFLGISRETVASEYALNAVTQQALAMLQYDTSFKDCNNNNGTPTPDSIVDSFPNCVAMWSKWTLTTKSPTAFNETQVEKVNDQDFTVSVEVPGALTALPPPVPTPCDPNNFYIWVTRDTDPNTPGDQTWIQVGQPITYTIWLKNCSSSASTKHLRRFGMLLPVGFTYVGGSSVTTGYASQGEPTITSCAGAAVDLGGAGFYYGCLQNDGAKLLDWPSGTAVTDISVKPSDPVVSVAFRVTPPSWGVFYVDPFSCNLLQATTGNFGPCAGTNAIRPGKQAPVVVGMFNIKGNGEGYGFGASAKLDGAGSGITSQVPP